MQSAHGAERRAHLVDKGMWLFEGREVPAFVQHMVVRELREPCFGPAPRHAEDLLGKDTDPGGQMDGRLRLRQDRKILPIHACGRGGGRRKPGHNILSTSAEISDCTWY